MYNAYVNCFFRLLTNTCYLGGEKMLMKLEAIETLHNISIVEHFFQTV